MLADYRNEIMNHSESVHSPKTTSNYRTTFKYLLRPFGNIPLSSLTKSGVEDYIEKRIRRTSVYARRKDLAYLSAFFKFVIDRK